MRAYLISLGAVVLASILGAIAFLVVGKLALYLDPAANESHLTKFIVAITGVAVAVGAAFPIFLRGVPWLATRIERMWPERSQAERSVPSFSGDPYRPDR